jgi:hypothetical protein
MNQRQIETRKLSSALVKEANKNLKILCCPFCGQKSPILCDSHSVPEFVLKNIADDKGYVDNIYNILETCIQKEKLGVGQAGCFKMICRTCDSQAFQNYEDENKLLQFYNEQQILNEIVLKNILRNIHGMNDQMSIFNLLHEKYGKEEFINNAYVCLHDLECYMTEMNQIIDNICEKKQSDYTVIYKNYLEYVTPIAFQGCFEMKFDCNGELINISHSDKDDYLRLFHITILPLSTKTLVLVFVREKCKEYHNLISQFNQKNEQQKLEFINYIIFKCSDNFFLSKRINKEIYTDDFKRLCDPIINNNGNIVKAGKLINITSEILKCPNFLLMNLHDL